MSPLLGPGLALLFVTVATYLVTALLLVGRLKASHRDVWEALGRPSALNFSILNALKLSKYVFLSADYRQLDDRAVGVYVLLLRILLCVTLAEAAVIRILQTHPAFFV